MAFKSSLDGMSPIMVGMNMDGIVVGGVMTEMIGDGVGTMNGDGTIGIIMTMTKTNS